MKSNIEWITPDKAQEYLKKNCKNNRRINERRISIYAEDMRDGKWQLNGEAIKFNKKGILIDGQHRLMAIIKSGVAVKMLILRDIDNNISLYDRGQVRATYASLRMSGFDKDIANTLTCGVAKLELMMMHGSGNFFSDSQIQQYLIDNVELILKAKTIGNRFAGTNGGRVGTNNAVMITAIYEALSAGESEEDLIKFCEIIYTGFYDNKNQKAAVVCRNDLLSNAIDIKTSSTARIRAVLQIDKAIYDFCRRNPRTRSYAKWDQVVYGKGEENGN